jgi:ubiquinone/menaquinone biosynthesis C-methylase UbiE
MHASPLDEPPKRAIAGYWDLRSESYARGVTGFKEEERLVWKRCLAPVVADAELRKALDVGAGTGFLSFILDDMGIDVTGLDLSRGMITRAREVSRRDRTDLEQCQGDAESLPFRSSSFDMVASRHLLWTLPDPGIALAEWMRVLRPGGRILAIDGNWFDPAISKKVGRKLSGLLYSFSQDRNPVPFRKFYDPIAEELPLFKASRPEQYLSLLAEAGLKDVTLDHLTEVNCFYKSHTSLSYRLANVDTVFLATGKKANQTKENRK